MGEDRPFPYRITKTGIEYYRDNVRKLTKLNEETPNREQILKEFWGKKLMQNGSMTGASSGYSQKTSRQD